MTIRYVGKGGSDSNNGTSWATRKLTLNGVEDSPVAAGDTVYVGPGIYREALACDIDGTNGNPITYIADITGEHTDGVGGIVRITGSDNDITQLRSYCISTAGDEYRTFRGFTFDMSNSYAVYVSDNDTIIEDCVFGLASGGSDGIQVAGTAATNVIIRRCLFLGGYSDLINFYHTATTGDMNALVENCIFLSSAAPGIRVDRMGGITIKNCLFWGTYYGVLIGTAIAVGQKVYVYNSIFTGHYRALQATTDNEIVEDYNALFGNITNRYGGSPVNWTGAHSNTYPTYFNPMTLLNGFIFPNQFSSQAYYSPLKSIAGTSESTDDFYGITRPTTSNKKSWGPVQYQSIERSTGQTHSGITSLVFPDAGSAQFIVPTTNVSTTVSVYNYRDTGYTGTNPQMIIKQPGQSNRITTASGAAETWLLLTDTFTPSGNPPYCVVELISNNTATITSSGIADCYFDDLLAT